MTFVGNPLKFTTLLFHSSELDFTSPTQRTFVKYILYKIAAITLPLGILFYKRGEYRKSEEYYQEGLDLARRIGYRDRISALLQGLGVLERRHGNYDRAEKYYQEGLAIAREIDHRERISTLLQNLGVLAADSGDYDLSENYYREALYIVQELGYRERISIMLANLGAAIEDGRGDHIQAEKLYKDGLALAREIGQRNNIASILIQLGECYRRQKKLDLASATFIESLEISRKLSSNHEFTAMAAYGLAKVKVEQDNIEEARCLGQESLAIFSAARHNKASDVEQWLRDLPNSCS